MTPHVFMFLYLLYTNSEAKWFLMTLSSICMHRVGQVVRNAAQMRLIIRPERSEEPHHQPLQVRTNTLCVYIYDRVCMQLRMKSS